MSACSIFTILWNKCTTNNNLSIPVVICTYNKLDNTNHIFWTVKQLVPKAKERNLLILPFFLFLFSRYITNRTILGNEMESWHQFSKSSLKILPREIIACFNDIKLKHSLCIELRNLWTSDLQKWTIWTFELIFIALKETNMVHQE